MKYITRRTDADKPALARLAIRIYHECRRVQAGTPGAYAQYRRLWDPSPDKGSRS